jgi:putative endonuclease
VAEKDEVGREGEQLAVDYLTERGYRVLDRNWRCRQGELDVVALDGRELVVVEVKARRSRAFGDPLEAVTDAKLTRLCVLAGAWRRAHPWVRPRGSRIDLVGVILPKHAYPTIDHLRGVA